VAGGTDDAHVTVRRSRTGRSRSASRPQPAGKRRAGRQRL